MKSTKNSLATEIGKAFRKVLLIKEFEPKSEEGKQRVLADVLAVLLLVPCFLLMAKANDAEVSSVRAGLVLIAYALASITVVIFTKSAREVLWRAYVPQLVVSLCLTVYFFSNSLIFSSKENTVLLGAFTLFVYGAIVVIVYRSKLRVIHFGLAATPLLLFPM